MIGARTHRAADGLQNILQNKKGTQRYPGKSPDVRTNVTNTIMPDHLSFCSLQENLRGMLTSQARGFPAESADNLTDDDNVGPGRCIFTDRQLLGRTMGLMRMLMITAEPEGSWCGGCHQSIKLIRAQLTRMHEDERAFISAPVVRKGAGMVRRDT